jgi:hypothetical protein
VARVQGVFLAPGGCTPAQRWNEVVPARVLVFSEFGVGSSSLNPSSSPGSYACRAGLLAGPIVVYEADPYLAAMVVWC